jgi:acetylornithine/N-succinyldiaminopimelate aminotransferase
LAAVARAIGPETAAILVEPVQGEGGIRPAPPGFLAGLRRLADDQGLVLAFDEVQCGIGRTGRLFAHEWAGIVPDVMAVAKGLGGGFPVGACLAKRAHADALVFGSHGSTFGGNPLAMAAGNAVLDVILADGFLAGVAAAGSRFRARLDALAAAHPGVIAEVRGIGLMLGLRCVIPNRDLIDALHHQGLLSVPAGDNVVRLLPPLIVTDAHLDEALRALDAACRSVAEKAA